MALQSETLQLPIPIMSLQRQYQAIGTQLEQAAISVLQSGHYILGTQVKTFETAFAQRTHCNHARSMPCSFMVWATAALILG